MIAVLWILLVICLIWLMLTELPAGWDGHLPLPYVIALSPFLWIPAVIFTVWGIVIQNWGFTLCAAAFLIASTARGAAYIMNDLKAPNTAQAVADHIAKNKARKALQQAALDADLTATHNDSAAATAPSDAAAADATAVTAATPTELGDTCRFMTLNCRFGRAQASHIVQAVRTRSIDVLACQEMSDSFVAELEAQGINELLPFHEFGHEHNNDNGGFNGIWSRVKPTMTMHSSCAIPAAEVPAMVLPVDEQTTVTVASAHTKSPMRGCVQWSQGCIGLGELVKGLPIQDESAQDEAALEQAESIASAIEEVAETDADAKLAAVAEHIEESVSTALPQNVVVVMGDLNSSIVHPSFRKLLSFGFHDAALSEAKGKHPTYPRWLRWPRIVLDHILFTGHTQATDVDSFTIAGTDHLALTATLHFHSKQAK
ncbi:endonuclease/exonuclease/phosphatase family protein [Bifidobacterium dolichotidis]|uniref:Endonuclease/exonuclease/phosphatase family protein n=2 Tax=Bifidobacterium dolichotidis TaxID=2306976 RepID=A0A430FQI3_9BIFI|nr:endonuclease/exonuclease/phosphatase family protein [Bifidobacterium dolichotidis]